MPGARAGEETRFWASPWPVRIGLGIVVAIYIAYSLFGIAAPFLWGHHGYHGATYMLRAIMSLRFHLLLPCTWAGFEFPPRFSWYLHHPIGYHHLLTLLIPIFGVHEWLARGVAAASGLGVIAALYALVRHYWSREAGLLAAAVWVALPIITTFSVLSDAMFPAMVSSIVMVYALLRFLDEPSRKWLILGCVFMVLGGFVMWEAYFQAFFQGLFAMALLFTARGRALRLGNWNAPFAWTFWTGLVSATQMGLHFLYTWSKGMLDDFKGSYAVRSTATFDYALERHKGWLDVLYGWPLLKLAILWLVIFVARAAAGRARRRDVAVLIFFVLNTFYLWIFAEAAAVHEYRVFWYSSFFVLVVVDLIADLHGVVVRLAGSRLVAAGAALLATAGYFYVEAPHAWKNLVESRVTMGTHGVANYNADYSKQLFAMEVARRTGPQDFIFVHNNMPRRIEFYYYMDRSNLDIGTLAQIPSLLKQHPRALVMMDASVAGYERGLLLELLRKHPGFIFDHYLLIDLRSDQPGIREYQWAPQPMSALYRYFVSHKYPPMKAVETRTTLSACLAGPAAIAPLPGTPALPDPPPARMAEALCAYQSKLLAGDGAGASAYLAKMVAAQSGAITVDAPIGTLAKVESIALHGRTGADVLLRVMETRAIPAGTVLRWRVALPVGPELVGETPLGGSEPLAWQPTGTVLVKNVSWSLPVAGTYMVRFELGATSPPPPLPSLVKRPSPVRSPASPPLAISTPIRIEAR